MQLTEQQLAELERRGYHVSGKWFHLLNRSETLEQLREVVEIAAILGIAPAGYRFVPERLADRAAREIMALARAHSTSGFKRDAEELQALASALQGKEVEKR